MQFGFILERPGLPPFPSFAAVRPDSRHPSCPRFVCAAYPIIALRELPHHSPKKYFTPNITDQWFIPLIVVKLERPATGWKS